MASGRIVSTWRSVTSLSSTTIWLCDYALRGIVRDMIVLASYDLYASTNVRFTPYCSLWIKRKHNTLFDFGFAPKLGYAKQRRTMAHKYPTVLWGEVTSVRNDALVKRYEAHSYVGIWCLVRYASCNACSCLLRNVTLLEQVPTDKCSIALDGSAVLCVWALWLRVWMWWTLAHSVFQFVCIFCLSYELFNDLVDNLSMLY